MNPSNNLPVEGKRIKLQKIISVKKFNGEELLAQLCYHYPQYTLYAASKLSYRQVQLLLRVAKQQQAIQMYNLTQIAAAPHTKKGSGVTKLSDHFKKTANS